MPGYDPSLAERVERLEAQVKLLKARDSEVAKMLHEMRVRQALQVTLVGRTAHGVCFLCTATCRGVPSGVDEWMKKHIADHLAETPQ